MHRWGTRVGGTRVAVIAVLLGLAVPGIAFAHVERTSYWPDPRPDTSVTPAAGGGVPKARSLASALNKRARGTTRVVCQTGSLSRLRHSIRRAESSGFNNRPTEPLRKLKRKAGKRLLRLNQ